MEHTVIMLMKGEGVNVIKKEKKYQSYVEKIDIEERNSQDNLLFLSTALMYVNNLVTRDEVEILHIKEADVVICAHVEMHENLTLRELMTKLKQQCMDRNEENEKISQEKSGQRMLVCDRTFSMQNMNYDLVLELNAEENIITYTYASDCIIRNAIE